jgi:hypothetical protein
MSLAIISNIDITSSPVLGKKVIKHIITCDSADVSQMVLEFIASDLGLESIPTSIDGLPADKLFITISNDNGEVVYTLNRTKVDSYAGWFGTSTYVSPVVIGNYTLVEIDSSLDIINFNQRLTEVKSHLNSVIKEKTDILAKSCDFESQINLLNVENNTLKVIINRFNRELDALNSKQDDAQLALNERMAQLETNITRINDIKKTKVNPRIEHQRPSAPKQRTLQPTADTIITALKKFDKNTLRPVNLTSSHLY